MRGRTDLIVHHLCTVTRWASIPYGWHGNGLLSLGWAVCQTVSCCCHILATSSWPERRKTVFSEANILWREAFLLFQVWIFEGGIVFGERRLLVTITRGKQRGLSGWFSGRWENEEWEDSRKTGGEIKLFFVLYLPQRLQESINLLALSAGDNSTHTRTQMYPNHTLCFVHVHSHTFLQTGCGITPAITDMGIKTHSVESLVQKLSNCGRKHTKSQRFKPLYIQKDTNGVIAFWTIGL